MLDSHIPAISFRRGIDNQAFELLRSLHGTIPFDEPVRAFPAGESVAPTGPAASGLLYPGGPINPVAQCPETGNILTLHAYKDLSAVLVRHGAEGPEILPAILNVTSIITEEQTGGPKAQTPDTLPRPRVSLQARPEGIWWRAMNMDVSESSLTNHLVAGMKRAAARILDAPPVTDPRAHARPVAGTRFAPFSIFPDPDPQIAADLTRKITALVRAHNRTSQDPVRTVIIRKEVATQPWSNIRGEDTVFMMLDTMKPVRTRREKNLHRNIRKLVESPRHGFPPAGRTDSQQDVILTSHIDAAGSAHERMRDNDIIRDISDVIETDHDG